MLIYLILYKIKAMSCYPPSDIRPNQVVSAPSGIKSPSHANSSKTLEDVTLPGL